MTVRLPEGSIASGVRGAADMTWHGGSGLSLRGRAQHRDPLMGCNTDWTHRLHHCLPGCCELVPAHHACLEHVGGWREGCVTFGTVACTLLAALARAKHSAQRKCARLKSGTGLALAGRAWAACRACPCGRGLACRLARCRQGAGRGWSRCCTVARLDDCIWQAAACWGKISQQ